MKVWGTKVDKLTIISFVYNTTMYSYAEAS